MTYKRKFRPGPVVTSVHTAVALIEDGRWLYANHKVLSPKWTAHWSLVQIRLWASGGRLREAIPNENGRGQKGVNDA